MRKFIEQVNKVIDQYFYNEEDGLKSLVNSLESEGYLSGNTYNFGTGGNCHVLAIQLISKKWILFNNIVDSFWLTKEPMTALRMFRSFYYDEYYNPDGNYEDYFDEIEEYNQFDYIDTFKIINAIRKLNY